MTVRASERGFTLIEVMISLGLFALIAVAGLALVDGVLGVEDRTGERLDRLSDYQRAMFIVASDLDQISPGPLSGGGDTIRFTRAAAGFGGPPQTVEYTTAGPMLTRVAGGAPQRVLTGLTGASWRFYAGGGWTDRWPPSEEARDAWPEAVALDMTVDRGTLRRVVALPARAGGGQGR